MFKVLLAFLMYCLSYVAIAQDIHEDYESYADSIVSSMDGLNRAIETIGEVNEGATGSDVVMTREMQLQITQRGRAVATAIASTLVYSERLQTSAVDEATCRSMIAAARGQLLEIEALINTFESLDVEGDQKAEAMSMAAIEFLGIGLFATKVMFEPLSTCAYVRAR